VLVFPCNQFGLQEPGRNNEILNGLRYVRPGNNFSLTAGVTVFGKGDVNGEKTSALYRYLKESCPPPTMRIIGSSNMFWDTVGGSDISWNYEKFLIDREGVPRYRFRPLAVSVKPYIEELLSDSSATTTITTGLASRISSSSSAVLCFLYYVASKAFGY